MGAGVVKAEPFGGREHTSQRSSTEEDQRMACSNCNTNFTLFKRKKPCRECGRHHCSGCLFPITGVKPAQRCCNKCLMLRSGHFTRSDLAQLKIRDLQCFLERRNVSLRNCKEKHDLIELMLSLANTPQYQQEQEQHRRHLEELQERRRQDDEVHVDRNAQPNSSSTSSNSSLSATIPTQGSSPTSTPEQPSAHPTIHQPQQPQDTTQSSNEPERPDTDSQQQPAQSSDTAELSGPQFCETPPTPHGAPRKRATLAQLDCTDDAEKLSTRQLKEILAGNYVNYKGCCEKWELIERVKRLWRQNQLEENAAEALEKSDADVMGGSELCKICMDSVINCVLLECGHMVTCVQCGRQLAECPICRQFIIRVVHVFKA